MDRLVLLVAFLGNLLAVHSVWRGHSRRTRRMYLHMAGYCLYGIAGIALACFVSYVGLIKDDPSFVRLTIRSVVVFFVLSLIPIASWLYLIRKSKTCSV
ncbi:MAG: hypothetical protein V1754_00810 [Pseudomonadota bacterium]